EHLGRALELLRGVREFFRAEQLVRGTYQSVGRRQAHISISAHAAGTCASWYARESMSAGVGADVEALCSKCGDVWHVVVAKVGQQIVKVQCKQCSGYHRYKSPHGAPADKKLPATHRPPREARAPVERFEKPAVPADLSRPTRPYRASEQFEVGERIEHPTFGQGVIELSEP